MFRTRKCDCAAWQPGTSTISRFAQQAAMRGAGGNLQAWTYCPWCGKELEKIAPPELRPRPQQARPAAPVPAMPMAPRPTPPSPPRPISAANPNPPGIPGAPMTSGGQQVPVDEERIKRLLASAPVGASPLPGSQASQGGKVQVPVPQVPEAAVRKPQAAEPEEQDEAPEESEESEESEEQDEDTGDGSLASDDDAMDGGGGETP